MLSGPDGTCPSPSGTSLDILAQLYQRREIWSSPISDVQEEGTSSSSYAPAPEGHATVGPGGA
jgi:hypothetical protein